MQWAVPLRVGSIIILFLYIVVLIVSYDDWSKEIEQQKKHDELAEQYQRLYKSWR